MGPRARPSGVVAGILADTHIPHRMKQLPGVVFKALEDVDVILHAGDVDQPSALAPLRRIAPIHAVRGNIHVLELSRGGASLPPSIELRLAGHHIVLTHGHLPGLEGLWFKLRDLFLRLLGGNEGGRFNARIARRLNHLYPQADIIVFGHTHRASIELLGDTLMVNPGSVCPTLREKRTVARMHLGKTAPRVELVHLEKLAGH